MYEVCAAIIQKVPKRSWNSYWWIFHSVLAGVWAEQSIAMAEESCLTQSDNHSKHLLLYLRTWCNRATYWSSHAISISSATCHPRTSSTTRIRHWWLTDSEIHVYQICLHVQKPSLRRARAYLCWPICRISQVKHACQLIIRSSLHWKDANKKITCSWKTKSNCS